MRPRVTLVALGTARASAVGSRIGAFARGLDGRGWDVTVIDPASPSATVADRMLSRTPAVLRSVLERAGIEGDVRPTAGWRVRHALRGVVSDVVVVSVPPFSLLGAAAAIAGPPVPLVVDYRDPWSARHHPPLLARLTRTIEQRALRRAAAVGYAGGPVLGDLLAQHLRLAPERVISIPNGFDAADTEGLPAPALWSPVFPQRSTTTSQLGFRSSRSAHLARPCSRSRRPHVFTTSTIRTSPALPHCFAAPCETVARYGPGCSAKDPPVSAVSPHCTPCFIVSCSNPREVSISSGEVAVLVDS